MTRRKILIVEDEVLVRCGLRSMVNWEKLGLDVIGDASNGKEALEIYEKEKPDIVMTDIKNAGYGRTGTDRKNTGTGSEHQDCPTDLL
ncbi:MAG: response regulator [Ruminococcus sp.]